MNNVDIPWWAKYNPDNTTVKLGEGTMPLRTYLELQALIDDCTIVVGGPRRAKIIRGWLNYTKEHQADSEK
jgi:hypothetical protein